MTIEIFGHIESIESGGCKRRLRMTVRFEMDRTNGQGISIELTPEEARMYMPGTSVTLRLFPDGRDKRGIEFAERPDDLPPPPETGDGS